MESYIVRIYRFHRDDPRNLVGIVESVGGGEGIRRAFTNLEDLWNILNHQMSEKNLPKHRKAGKEAKTFTLVSSTTGIPESLTSRVIVDTRRLSKEDRALLLRMAIKKMEKGEIIALADDDATEDISQTAKKEGWILNGIDSW